MSDKPRCDPFALIDRLVRGEITNEEAGILLAQVQKNDELAAAVRANYRADFLLALLLSARVDEDDSFPILPVLPGETTMNPATNGSDDLWKSLETMVRYEREAVPVVRPASRTPSETAVTTTSLRAPFEPREKHAGDVIKSSPRFDFPFLIRVCLYFALITWLCLTTRPDDHLDTDDHFNAIARVTETVDAQWSDGARNYRRGQRTSEGSFSLKSGLVQLETTTGTRIILEGPTEFALTTPKDAFCGHGKISTFIPEGGAGLEVVTPHATVIDRGTAFYLEVSRDKSQLDVVAGKVDLVREGVTSTMERGDSASVLFDTTPEIRRTLQTPYMSDKQFFAKVTESSRRETLRRQSLIEKKALDPHTLVCFDFTGQTKNSIPNLSSASRTDHVSIHTQLRGEGPYYGTQSVQFGSKTDYALFDLPGSFETLTCEAEVRIDSIDRAGNVLFATATHLRSSGGFLWQIDRVGRMQIQMTNRKNEVLWFESPPVIGRGQWGTWNDFAVSLDSRKGVVAFYANGKMVSTHEWKNPVPLLVEQAALGNVPPGFERITNRFLEGGLARFVLSTSASPNADP